jgi:hypothetical protein
MNEEAKTSQKEEGRTTGGKMLYPFDSIRSRGLSLAISFGLCGIGITGWKEFRSININLGIVSLTVALGNIKNNIDVLFRLADMIFNAGWHYRAMSSSLTMHAIIVDKLLASAAGDDREEFLRKAKLMLPYAYEAVEYVADSTFPGADVRDVDKIWANCLLKEKEFFAGDFSDEEKPVLFDIAIANLRRASGAVEKEAQPAVSKANAKRSRKSGADEAAILGIAASSPAQKKRKRATRVAEKIGEATKA